MGEGWEELVDEEGCGFFDLDLRLDCFGVPGDGVSMLFECPPEVVIRFTLLNLK